MPALPQIRRLFLCSFLSLTFASVHAGPAEEARALSKESYQLEAEMRDRVPDLLEREPELKSLTEQSKEMGQKIAEALKNHPALAEARAKRDQAFSQLTMAIGKGDAAGREAAKDAYAKAEQDIRAEGRKVPEIQKMMDDSLALGSRYLTERDAAYARQPETAALAKKVAELKAQATALRREARAAKIKE